MSLMPIIVPGGLRRNTSASHHKKPSRTIDGSRSAGLCDKPWGRRGQPSSNLLHRADAIRRCPPLALTLRAPAIQQEHNANHRDNAETTNSIHTGLLTMNKNIEPVIAHRNFMSIKCQCSLPMHGRDMHARGTRAIAEKSGPLALDVTNLKIRRLPRLRDVNSTCQR